MGIFFGPGSPSDQRKKLRIQQEEADRRRVQQTGRTNRLLDEARGGQPGPFRPGLLRDDPEQPGALLNETKSLSEQAIADQNRIMAELIQTPGMGPGAANSIAAELFPSTSGPSVGSPSPKDFTVDSIENFRSSDNFNDLQRYIDPLAQRRVHIAENNQLLAEFKARRPSDQQTRILMERMINLDSLEILQMDSQPQFFGFGFDNIGEGVREFRRRFGDEDAQEFNTWWNEYDIFMTEWRRTQFGTQFTPTEQKIFKKMTVRPSDSAATASFKISKQYQIFQRAMFRQTSVLEDLGFNVPRRRGLEGAIESEVQAPITQDFP